MFLADRDSCSYLPPLVSDNRLKILCQRHMNITLTLTLGAFVSSVQFPGKVLFITDMVSHPSVSSSLSSGSSL